MNYLDYRKLQGGKKFNFNTKDQFNIDKILLELLAQIKGGDKQYDQIESFPKLLLPKELMRFYFPCPIPEVYFGGGNRAFNEIDEEKLEQMSDVPWKMEKPRGTKDYYSEELKDFFKHLDEIRIDQNNLQLAYCYAALTEEKAEKTLVFKIRSDFHANTEQNKMLLFSPELMDDLFDRIVKDLAVKKDKDLLKAFLYAESILFLNNIDKSQKLKNSWGYIINTSFYKALSMREVAINYDALLTSKHLSNSNFKPYDVFRAKLKYQPIEYRIYQPYMDYALGVPDDNFFTNFRRCIEKGNPKSHRSGEKFLRFMGVNTQKGRSSRALWMDLATKILNYKR